MKKSITHTIVDSASLLAGGLLLVTGGILAFVLPHRGGSFGLSWLDVSRYTWAEMHYYFSLIFCVLILIHLVSHWSFLRSLAWGTTENPRPISIRVSVILIAVLFALLVILPFLIPANTSDAGPGLGRGQHATEMR